MQYSEGMFRLEPDLEHHYQMWSSNGADERAMSVTLLGDESYVRPAQMPKHNGPVTMLREPKVALRYSNAWGIPTSKSAHAQRADYFAEVATKLQAAWDELVERASASFGKHGSLVSAIYRSHFPAIVQSRLRFLAHGKTMVKDAERLHRYLSKSRSPIFR